MYGHPIVVTPDTGYLRSLFAGVVTPETSLAFVSSRREVTAGFINESQRDIGFSLSGKEPSFDRNWSAVVIDKSKQNRRLQWSEADRTICDQTMNSTYQFSSRQFAHAAMEFNEASSSIVGYLITLSFVTVRLMRGLMLSINVRDLRVGFLLALNEVSEMF
jgi:hypothetical protein